MTVSNFAQKAIILFAIVFCILLVSCGNIQQEPQNPPASKEDSDISSAFEGAEENSSIVTDEKDEEEYLPEKTEEDPSPLIDYSAPVRSSNTAQDWINFLEKSSSYPGVELDLDYLAAKGTPVYSPIKGVVEKIETESVWPFGRHIVVLPSDNSDIKIVIAHLDLVEEQLKVGDKIDNATQIGISGITGSISYPAVSISVTKKTDDGYSDISVDKWDTIFSNWPNCISSNLNK